MNAKVRGDTLEGIYWRGKQIYQMCLELHFPIRGCGNCVNAKVSRNYNTKCLIEEKSEDQEWNPMYFCKLWKLDMRLIAIIRKGQ